MKIKHCRFGRWIVASLTVAVALVTLVAPATASDADTAKSLVITRRDVGAGYAESKTTTSPNAFGKLVACVGRTTTNRKVVADFQGSEFSNRTNGSVIFSSVQVVKSPAMAKADRAVLSDAKFPNCVAQLLSGSQAAAAHLTGISARRVSVKPYGDYSTAVLVEASGTAATGQPISITQIEVGIGKGRAEVSAGFTAPGAQPFDRATAERILAQLNRRLDRAHV